MEKSCKRAYFENVPGFDHLEVIFNDDFPTGREKALKLQRLLKGELVCVDKKVKDGEWDRVVSKLVER